MPGGRPLKYKTPEEMQVKIDLYFENEVGEFPVYDKKTGDPIYNKHGDPCMELKAPTVAGLALYLGFCNRASMYDYDKYPKFSNTIKKAVARIEQFAENRLYIGKPTGAIFWLKNHGWIDKTEKKVEGDVKVSLANFLDSLDD